jgi:WD40 repeat protein
VWPVTVAGRDLIASVSGVTIRIWNPATRKQQVVLQGHQRAVRGVCQVTIAGRDLIASVGYDRTLLIWDPADGRVQALMRVEEPLRTCVQIAPEGLAAGGEAGLYGFDLLHNNTPESPQVQTGESDT